jgi:3-phenylpropionate/cinnamic acid dioxygenase small subunit
MGQDHLPSRGADREAIDYAAITAVLSRYCHALDGGDVDSIIGLFDENCVLRLRTTEAREFRTRAKLREYFDPHERSVREPLIDVRHSLALPDVSVQGDTAKARAYFEGTAIQVSDGMPLIVAGRYDDELIRSDDGWRFTSRTISVLYTYSPTCASAPRRFDASHVVPTEAT